MFAISSNVSVYIYAQDSMQSKQRRLLRKFLHTLHLMHKNNKDIYFANTKVYCIKCTELIKSTYALTKQGNQCCFFNITAVDEK